MNIGKFFGKVEANLAHSATVRHENNIDKFFKIHDSDTFGDSFNQMYLAREIISRFAQRNGVKVDVYDAKKMASLEDHDKKFVKDFQDKFSDKINLVVTDLRSGKSKGRIVAADTEKVYPKEVKKGFFIVSNPQDGTEYSTRGHWSTEDTFLRNLYRNIESMVTEVTKKSEK